jgi:hypothetical protein
MPIRDAGLSRVLPLFAVYSHQGTSPGVFAAKKLGWRFDVAVYEFAPVVSTDVPESSTRMVVTLRRIDSSQFER